MKVLTDDIIFTDKFLENNCSWEKLSADSQIKPLQFLMENLLGKKDIYLCEISDNKNWDYLFITGEADKSQFDTLVDFSRTDLKLNGKIACIAGCGKEFHGFRSRKWETLNGNLHLSVMFQPLANIEYFHPGILVLTAVSILKVLDKFSETENLADIKWVNDIILQNKKIAGIITQATTQGEIVKSAIIGLGMNVFTEPCINTDSYIPSAGAMANYITKRKLSLNLIFNLLSDQLNLEYEKLKKSCYNDLLDFYTNRSLIIGEKVKVLSDPVNGKAEEVFEGIVEGIGKNLEIYFRDREYPVTKGRLIL